MSHYDAMDAHELRQELEEWTGRTLQWADDLVTAIDSQDIVTAALMAHAYKDAQPTLKAAQKDAYAAWDAAGDAAGDAADG